MTGRIMIEFEMVCEKTHPDIIVVYGDTNTTLAGAIVGAKMKIPVAHVEAGIRMKPRDMPEEINRVLVDRISRYLFCPSERAVENLKHESLDKNAHFVGDVMYDLYLKLEPYFKFDLYDKLNLQEEGFLLLTLHRDYNVDEPQKLKDILMEVEKISKEIQVVFPIHPRTHNRLQQFHLNKYLSKVIVTEPADYLTLMGLVKKSFKVITDSGGLQKEAYYAGKSCAVLMPDTGWVELIENGNNVLCDPKTLYEAVKKPDIGDRSANIYGDGRAGQKIVGILTRAANE
jgi:UDP-N-acetylglucosamine 2-epimerase (non-hydrolysing)